MSETMVRGYFTPALPESLLRETRILAIRRGGRFGLEQSLAEGLGLWVARERERPRPAGEEARRLESLRLLCCRLLALAFEQLQAAADASGRAQTHNPAGLQEGLQAGAWLLSDDSDHPLSYLNVCDILDFPTARGRDWARQLLTAIEEGRRRATTPMTNTSKGQGYPGCRSRACSLLRHARQRFVEY